MVPQSRARRAVSVFLLVIGIVCLGIYSGSYLYRTAYQIYEGWQFDHILPLVYFDFEKDAELRLCWNFTNIRVQRVLPESEASGLDILGAKAYFETLYTRTGYPLCREMLDKIKRLEGAQLGQVGKQVSFLNQNMSLLTTVASFNAYEYGQLNEGIPLEKILEEKRMFQ